MISHHLLNKIANTRWNKILQLILSRKIDVLSKINAVLTSMKPMSLTEEIVASGKSHVNRFKAVMKTKQTMDRTAREDMSGFTS